MSGDRIRETFNKILSDYDKNLEKLEVRYADAVGDVATINECVMSYKVLCNGLDRLVDNLREIMSNDTDA